jgi:hypothetical protein
MTATDSLTDIFKDIIGGIGDLFVRGQRELLTVLRQPSPLNITAVYQANAAGVIGGGLTTPDPITLFQCPSSHEAWINRIGITSPGHPPGAPLTTGQAICSGSTAAELIFFLPLGGVVAPILITEGRLSAMQLNPSERILFSADGLPANTQLKIDLQIVLVTGVSVDTPLPPGGRIRNVNVLD